MMSDGGLMAEAGVSAARTAKAAAGPAVAPGFASWRYYTCLLLVGGTAIGMHLSANALEAYFERLPLPLKTPLYRMSTDKLKPYELAVQQPKPLSAELVESLGTEEYLNWVLHDPRLPPADATHTARVFITYYTGKPDMVPHEPRECMQAAGWELVSEDRFAVDLTEPGGGRAAIPIAILGFEPPPEATQSGPPPRLHVMYFFNANGRYETDRTGVRLAVANLSDRYSYYAKIEISFSDESGRRLPDRAAAEAGLKRLLPVLMNVLWQDHLPDWAAVKAGGRAS